ncbi:hypothetical protein FrCorBMG51_08745 [Protofrankia coriariae]|uniref:FtsK domain-containing protein n=2 Tax=Protofrankia coriariae TaxID=1562887 RepID=A0ABR5F5E6_9ACTN|nr:hypothetical protein FrCorBMG51_08745 [Protofrankia coriariae]
MPAPHRIIERRLDETIRDGRPGRALTDRKLMAHVALPRIDSVPEPASLGPGLVQAVRAARSAWVGPRAPGVRVLPAVLPAGELPGARACPTAISIGVSEADLQPATVDLFGADQHLVVLGDSGCGKTNLVRLIVNALVDRYSDTELVFAIFDPRRGLRRDVPEKYDGGYAPNAALAQGLATAVSGELAKRLPDDPTATVSGDVSGERTFAGPRIVLLVDDYDMLVAGNSQPLSPLVPFLASARDIGLHVVMTRRVAGAARGLYEPFTLSLRESGAVGLVMSGDRGEGYLFTGVRASSMPPGRGLLVRPGMPAHTVQTALAAEDSGK